MSTLKETFKVGKKKSIGLSLGSGAVRGYALFPIINKLIKEGLEIKAVSGSSVGALVGAYFALHGEVDSFFKISTGMKKKDYLKLVDPNNLKVSLIKGEKIKNFLKENAFHDASFEDTKIELIICVTDPVKKKPVYLNKGKILDAVMASISIPGIFPPYIIKDNLFIDGGTLDPVPVKPLLEMDFEKIVGVNLTRNTSQQSDNSGNNLFQSLINVFYMMMEQLAREEEGRRLFMLNPEFEPDPARMLSFYDWKKNFEIGQKIIEDKFEDLIKWLDE